MELPNYQNGSLVNLMQTIRESLGGAKSPVYPPLQMLHDVKLGAANRVVLFVIDGLGYRYLQGQDGVLHSHLEGAITSVFPPTTASAVTTLLTGDAPQQHGVTGWFMWMKELGAVVATLPFTTRVGQESLTQAGIEPGDLFTSKPLMNGLDRPTFIVQPEELIESDYTAVHRGPASLCRYSSLPQCIDVVRDLLEQNDRCFIYAYWGVLDATAHEHGIGSAEALAQFRTVDEQISRLLFEVQVPLTLIATADHGFIDTTEETRLHLDDHPHLAETLTVPLTGEPRVAFCYVRPDRREQFVSYVTEHLADACTLLPSQTLVERSYFGLGEPHPRLLDRIGDYALIMKGRYAIKDRLLGERPRAGARTQGVPAHIGVHGGLSEEELLVPLVLFSNEITQGSGSTSTAPSST